MAGKRRRFGVGAALSIGLVLALTSMAWACSGRPRIYGLSEQSGAKGTVVQMSGGDLRPGAPVEIRWNGAEGEKVAETIANSSGQFSVTVTVPDVAADVYSLVAVSEGRVTQAAFEVTGAKAATAANAAEATTSSASSGGSSPLTTTGLALGGLGLLALAGFGLVTISRRITGTPAVA